MGKPDRGLPSQHKTKLKASCLPGTLVKSLYGQFAFAPFFNDSDGLSETDISRVDYTPGAF